MRLFIMDRSLSRSDSHTIPAPVGASRGLSISYESGQGWCCGRREEIGKTGGRCEAGRRRDSDMPIWFDDRDSQHNGPDGHSHTSRCATGAYATAVLRMLRWGGRGVMVLMVCNLPGLGGARMEPLHRRPGHARGQEHQNQGHGSAVTQEVQHNYKIGAA